MKIAIPAALGATIAIAIAAPAQAETIRYRVSLDVAGSWSEALRANPDRYPPAQVATRDTALRWSLSAAVRDVAFRDGSPAAPLYPVADTSMSQQVLSSTFTDYDGEAGTCREDTAVATGAGALAMVGSRMVLRPSSDALLDLQCATPHVRHAITVDLLRNAGSNDVPALGAGPLDAAFAFPAGSFGAVRVVAPVTVAEAQRAFDRCPRQDPGHTVACAFDWHGEVTLERLSPIVRAPLVARDGRTATVSVSCFTACRPRLKAGSARRSYALAADRTAKLTVRLDERTRRALRRGASARLVVQIGAERRILVLRRAGHARRADG